ncbi:MAG: plastocyanin/azurin family copper-binding protein, partial [Planctomycetota bacterium]
MRRHFSSLFFYLTAAATLLAASMLLVPPAIAADGAGKKVKKPRVFLNKSPRIVALQLKRLSDAQLLLVDRDDQDKKYIPVHQAILARPDVSGADRIAAAQALSRLQGISMADVLLSAIGSLTERIDPEGTTARRLQALLLKQPTQTLKDAAATISATAEQHSDASPAAFAALLMAGESDKVHRIVGQGDADTKTDYLTSISYLSDGKVATAELPLVQQLFSQSADQQLVAATSALGAISSGKAKTFLDVAQLATAKDASLRAAAVQTLASVPNEERDIAVAKSIVDAMVTAAERTPPKDRTSDLFLSSAQLVDSLLVSLEGADAKSYRDRMRKIVVRVVKIATVEEEMRYDQTHFAAAAGTDIQIILDNEDLMPHNLVFCLPDTLRQVAADGAAVGIPGGKTRQQYVPDNNVVAASDMVPAHQKSVLTFRVPDQPGEYPFVCTFPQHWLRMYGVMTVVEDLDAWNKNPTTPKDPLGNNRQFVAKWTIDNFPKQDIQNGMKGRVAEIGRRIFEEASCAACHKIGDQGGEV